MHLRKNRKRINGSQVLTACLLLPNKLASLMSILCIFKEPASKLLSMVIVTFLTPNHLLVILCFLIISWPIRIIILLRGIIIIVVVVISIIISFLFS